MGKSHGKGNLSEAEKESIFKAYFEDEQTIKAISDALARTYSTIYRVIRKEKERRADEERRAEESKPLYDVGDIPPPLFFMVQNYFELTSDIQITRARGSVQVLPGLYRLRMEIHSQIQAIIADEAEQTEDDADALLATILHTIQALPPMMRHTIHTQLQQIELGNILPFSGSS